MHYMMTERIETSAHPAGVTISKRALPQDRDFGITEYCWGNVSLWFVDDDEFTDDERQKVYEHFVQMRDGQS